MGDYLKRTQTGLKEDNAVDTSTGASDSGKVVKLDGQGKLADSLFPTGIGDEDFQAEATEALAAGEFVNVFDDSGTFKMRKADAGNNRRAHGFVRASVSMGASGTVFSGGYINDQLTGLSPGSTYYLDTTAGAAATSAPASAANAIHQEVGFALSASQLIFIPKEPILLVG